MGLLIWTCIEGCSAKRGRNILGAAWILHCYVGVDACAAGCCRAAGAGHLLPLTARTLSACRTRACRTVLGPSCLLIRSGCVSHDAVGMDVASTTATTTAVPGLPGAAQRTACWFKRATALPPPGFSHLVNACASLTQHTQDSAAPYILDILVSSGYGGYTAPVSGCILLPSAFRRYPYTLTACPVYRSRFLFRVLPRAC